MSKHLLTVSVGIAVPVALCVVETVASGCVVVMTVMEMLVLVENWWKFRFF
jgi:hypothetical protein